MKNKWLIIGLIVILAVGGFLFWKWFNNRPGTRKSTNQDLNSHMVYTVERGEIRKTVSATGNLSPIEERELRTLVNGEVIDIKVQEGQRVKKGEVLIELSKYQQQLEYLKAQTAYDAARINGSTTTIKEQELNLKIASNNLEATVIKAPFAGLITDVMIKKGDNLGANQFAALLIDDSSYYIEVNVDESDSREVQVGQEVIIDINAIPEKSFKGKVSAKAQRAIEVNGVITVPVKVMLEDTTHYLMPNFSADLEIIVERVEDQLVIPITAVFENNGREQVIKIVDGNRLPTAVKTGLSDGVQIVVEEGLNPGDRVLINTYNYANSGPGNNPGGNPAVRFPGAGVRGRF